MKTINGDLIHLALAGEFDVIVHGCNCFNAMGAGIAKQIKQYFPEAYNADIDTVRGDRNKIGTYSFVKLGELTVINAYTQYDTGFGKDRFEYDGFNIILNKLKDEFPTERFGFPLIGSGLAGGNWNIIGKMIDDVFHDRATIVKLGVV
jgi:O-acetyl-ADP-ribose deacetylase (regulator of RNase III)